MYPLVLCKVDNKIKNWNLTWWGLINIFSVYIQNCKIKTDKARSFLAVLPADVKETDENAAVWCVVLIWPVKTTPWSSRTTAAELMPMPNAFGVDWLVKGRGCLPLVAQSHRCRHGLDSSLNRVDSDLGCSLKLESLSCWSTASRKFTCNIRLTY